MDASDEGRVSKPAAIGSTIALFILAIACYSFRTFVRWHYKKLKWLDDGFLAFAVICMAVSFGLWFAMLDNLYKAEALIYDPFASALMFGNIIQIAIDVQIYTSTYIAISITGIFAVKFSFLFFFRSVISRLRPMVLYWRFAVTYTAVAWALSVGVSFAACSYFDSRAVNCAQGDMLAKALDVSIVLLVFDVSSDTLIIGIPLLVLRQLKIPRRSKIYLAFSFCLSVVMIVCAVLQGATLVTSGADAIDVVWQIYFQMVELILAVTVVSLTAFRTLFVQRGSRNNTPRSPQNPKWYSYKRWKKSVSDRTTSTGFTGYSGYSEEMQPPLAARQPMVPASAGQAEPIARSPTEEPKPPFSPADAEKAPPSYKSTGHIPLIPASSLPISREPTEPPTLQHTDSTESSDTDIGIPIQGSEPPSSPPAILTPAPSLASPLASRMSPDLDQNHPQPLNLAFHLATDVPRMSSSNSISHPSTSLRSRTPPVPRHLSSASSGPRPALLGPTSSSTHTSRTDSLARPLTASSSALPPLPHASFGHPPIEFARGVPTRKPLPSPLTFPREPPPPPDLSSPPPPLSPSMLASPPASSTIGTATSTTRPSRYKPNKLQKPSPPQSPSTQPILSPPSPAHHLTPTASHAPSVSAPSTATGTTFSPRTPRSNLSPDLRISGVQRAIRSGIERAMSFEPAGGAEEERW